MTTNCSILLHVPKLHCILNPVSLRCRNCIGQSFAINEEKVVVSNILRRFELRVDDSHCIEMDPKVILKAKYDIKLHIKPLLPSAWLDN
ncbi:hypothetical protein EMCRGX_G004635 [Ephydatia muelleri]